MKKQEQNAKHETQTSKRRTLDSRRGFMVSLAVSALVLLLILLTTILHTNYLASERMIKEAQRAAYMPFLFQEVLIDVNEIAGPMILLNNSNSTITISISDSLPKSNFTTSLENYKTYLQNNFSSTAHANIAANFSSIEDGTLEIVFLDDYLYADNYTNSEGNTVLFGTSAYDGKTNALTYNINLTTNRYRYSITDFSWIAGGDINVTIRYTDLNGTWQSSGTLNSTSVNTLTIRFISTDVKNVQIMIGRKDSRQGALWIKDNNASASFSVAAILPLQNASDRFGYYYNATLNYSHGEGAGMIRKNAMIGNG